MAAREGTVAAGTRERIVDAAERVLRERGIAGATTKEIARAAGLSEGSLYNYFAGKEELFLAVLGERLPPFVGLIRAFPGRAGTGTVAGNLAEVARAALAFYRQAVPMGASFFADPGLLARHRALLRERGAGPHRANEAVAAYLRAEQHRGRVRADADPAALADLLLGACLLRAYWSEFLAEAAPPEDEAGYVDGIVATLLRGVLPAGDT